ncbi:MAG: phosphodiester glycosidase family protein [Firmicutes bacterium]|nr:phosphodiester glycosidase family protein [Bacillota bacterium]
MLVLTLAILLIIAPAGAQAAPPAITDITAVPTEAGVEFVIKGSGDLEHRLLYYVNPSKIILELPGYTLDSGLKVPAVSGPGIQRVRLTQNQSGIKVAIDLYYPVPRSQVTVKKEPGGLRLVVPTLFEESRRIRVTPGVYYHQVTRGTPEGPIEINILELDPEVAQVKVETRLAQERTLGREPLSAITKRAGALAGINGSFFSSDGTPLGLYIQDGRLITEPILHRTALAVTEEGKLLITPFGFSGKVRLGEVELPVSGLNRQRYTDELIIYTPDRGETTETNSFGFELVIIDGKVAERVRGDAAIPRNGYVVSGHGKYKDILQGIEVGTPCTLQLETEPDWRRAKIRYAVGAGPQLVKNGQIQITADEESFKPDITQGKAPRSALGLTPSGKIVAVTVNGRKANISVGMTLEELAELMVELGCEQALNLDGGGSVTMVIRDRPLNMPSDGRERQVSSAILFIVNEDHKESF